MAEFVQQSIEEMLPELEQMERIQLFTREETGQILKKRKSHEYRLRRRTKYKEDYLQYIQYEKNLLELIKERRKNLGINYKRLEIDIAIVQRIHRLYRHVITRFKSDVELWLGHIRFSHSRKERSSVSRIFTQMLQVHNKNPDLWIAAAKWEFESNKNPENARTLMQRGLRFNPNSKPLWLEYYRLELLFAEKLRKRKSVLEASGIESDEHTEVLDGMVAQIVNKKAVEAFPGDLKFALSFLPICRRFEFMKKQEENLFQGLEELYSYDPHMWDAKARREVDKQQKDPLGKFHSVYEEALQKLDKDEIWSCYILACLDIIQQQKFKEHREKETIKLLDIFERASEKVILSPDLYLKWVEVLLEEGLDERAADVLELAVSVHTKSPSLWQRKLELMIQLDKQEKEILQTFTKARESVPEKESYSIWTLTLEFCAACKSQELSNLYEKGIMSCREICVPIKEQYLQWTFLSDGIHSTRELYKRLLLLKPLSMQFYFLYIKFEKSQEKQKIKLIRNAYEDAIKDFGASNAELWIDYIKLETQHANGSAEKAGQIHFRALRCLEGEENQRFVTKHTLLQTGHLN